MACQVTNTELFKSAIRGGKLGNYGRGKIPHFLLVYQDSPYTGMFALYGNSGQKCAYELFLLGGISVS
jgi:hypothetical protein